MSLASPQIKASKAPIRLMLLTVRADHGGGQKHMSDLIHGLKTSYPAYEIYVGAPHQEPYFSIYQKEALDCFELPFRRFSVSRFLGLVKFIRQHQITLVHSHGRGAGLYSRLLKLFIPGLQVVHTFHGCFHEPTLLGWIKVKLDQLFEPLADFYLSVSKDEYAQLLKWKFAKKDKCLTIPNGIHLPPQTHQCKSSQTKTLGTLARVSEQKGWDLLFDQYRDLLKQVPQVPVKILIGGFPKGQMNIPSELQNHVTEVGEVQTSACFLSEIDIYVSSSRVEGLPLTVLEAMGAGVPCLLSEVTGHQYFIDHQVALGFKLGDSATFSSQLKGLMTDRILYDRLVRDGRQFVSDYHTIQMQVQETVKVYDRILTSMVTI